MDGTGERDHRPLQFEEFTLELVDTAGVRGARALRGEDVRLDLVDVVLDGVRDVQVVVDDMVGYGVQYRCRALAELLRVGLQVLAQGAEGAVPAVADGDDEVGPAKTMISPVVTTSLVAVSSSCST